MFHSNYVHSLYNENSYLFIVKLDNNKEITHFTSNLGQLDHTVQNTQ